MGQISQQTKNRTREGPSGYREENRRGSTDRW